jgi:carbohydrate-selective porin OprB
MMNNRILTIAAVLAASLIAGVFATTPMAAYAGGDDGDSSETDTEQSIKQKNFGGDASTNVNCADQDISGATEDGLLPPIDAQVCGTAAIDLGALFG